MNLNNRTNLTEEHLISLEAEVAGHRTLQDVLNWGFRQESGTNHPGIISDVIVQDEFSHDVIVPLRDGLVLVYGTT